MLSIIQKEECSECGGSLIETSADIVCRKCGLVFGRKFVDHPAAFNLTLEQEDTTHQSLGSRESVADGLGTFIDYYAPRGYAGLLKDSQGRNLEQNARWRFKRLKRMNDIFFHVDDKQREYRGLMIIHRIVGALELSTDLKERASAYFRKACQKEQGSPTIAELAIGAIYLSIRSSKLILKIDDLKQVCDRCGFPLEQKKILWAAAFIRKKASVTLKVPKPEEYLERVLQNLKTADSLKNQIEKANMKPDEYIAQLRQVSLRILHAFPHRKRGGRNPFVFACAAVCGAEIILRKINPRRRILTQRDVATVNKVAEFSLREHFLKTIKEELDGISQQVLADQEANPKQVLVTLPLQTAK
jgi:transcription initiation factor TFIIIB Brf1 subunit/transcription initiation factor TFIIB